MSKDPQRPNTNRQTPPTALSFDSSMTEHPPIAIAAIVRARGLRGEVVANPLTSRLERFDDVGDLLARTPDGSIFSLKMLAYHVQGSQLILQFAEVDTLEKAKSLVGCMLCVPAAEAVELEADEFFQHQLLGCAVDTVSGDRLGEVVRVLETTGTPVLVVRSPEGREYMIPFASSICPKVDAEKRRILVDPPQGLLEL